MNQEDRRKYLIERLSEENTVYKNINIPPDDKEQEILLRSLMNIRMPGEIDNDFLRIQDEYLLQRNTKRGIVDIDSLIPVDDDKQIFIWRGDITRLRVGAIVNAANSGMTGCYQPCHNCIDNCIHTYAGVELRNYCSEIMKKQGYEEPTGNAKITPAFNLPCDYVIHTVGPIVQGKLTKEHERLLISCYESCLKKADENDVKSIAFCCISTGVFRFPNERAAKLAVQTVKKYKLDTNSNIKVIFNVFKEETNKSIGSSFVADKEIEKEYMSDMIKEKIEQADAVIIGAGAGLSTSAGFVYSGERFDKYFGDFKEKYNFNDMYSGGFYPYKTLEEYWGYWCRYIYVNRYMDAPKPLYSELLELVQGKNYFVLTTNVDHCFQKAGFDKERLFYTQGDYGLFQCCKPCHNDTYDNEDAIRKMVLSQGFKISDDNLIAPEKGSVNMTVPSDLIPKCPECGRPMGMNLRADNTFAEDDGWHRAAERYRSFLWSNKDRKVLFIELGVGYNTPGIIKYPFWQYTQSFKDAFYICVNKGEIEIPYGIKDKSICIDSDISKVIET